MKLNIHQLTLAKLAQLGRYHSGSYEVPGSILTGGTFYWNYDNVANFVYLQENSSDLY